MDVQSPCISGYVVAEYDAPHARLAGTALPHEQDLLFLGLLDLISNVADRGVPRSGAVGSVGTVSGSHTLARRCCRRSSVGHGDICLVVNSEPL